MPIPVVCPGCKASFNVSDKFAGKQGPCPKCKTPINIPKAAAVAAAPKEEIKIHAPEEATGGPKGSSGRPVLKPISRNDAKLSPVIAGIIVATIILLFVGAWLGGDVVKRPYRPPAEDLVNESVAAEYYSGLSTAFAIRSLALAVIAFPIVWAGYLILRDDELAPFRGRALWFRVGICFAVYLLLWGLYALLPYEIVSSFYIWLIIIPLFAVGFAVAYFTFEFDPTSAAVHFGFFVAVTLMLGVTAGLTMPWSDGLQMRAPVFRTDEAIQMPLYDSLGQPLNDAAKKEQMEKNKAATPTANRPAKAQ